MPTARNRRAGVVGAFAFMLACVSCAGDDPESDTATSEISPANSDATVGAIGPGGPGGEDGAPDSPDEEGGTLEESDGAVSATEDASVGATPDAATGTIDSGVTSGGLGCGKTVDAPGTANRSVTAGGKTRTFVAYSPAPVGTALLSLVFVFHGDGGTGAGIHTSFPLEKTSGSEAVVFYPDGVGKTWDLDHMENELPAFDAMIEYAKAHFCIDPSRIFATGFSRGGYMSNQLGCFRGTVLRGIAPQSGGGPYQIGGKFDSKGQLICPGGFTSALAIHGLSDSTVAPSEETFSENYWIYKNACTKTFAASTPSPCQLATGCGGGKSVGQCLVSGMGHSIWSNAAPAVWGFFKSL